jgi:hypothetical protein
MRPRGRHARQAMAPGACGARANRRAAASFGGTRMGERRVRMKIASRGAPSDVQAVQ